MRVALHALPNRRPGSFPPLQVLLLCVLALAPSAGAQAFAPAGAVGDHRKSADTTSSSTETAPQVQEDSWEMPLRIGGGVIGSASGFLIGAVAGAGTAGGCHGEMCTLGPALLGGAIGSVVVASLMASAPQMGSTCSPDGRLLRGLAGGVTGALTGGVLGLVGGPVSIITYLAGSGIGAGWAAATCGK